MDNGSKDSLLTIWCKDQGVFIVWMVHQCREYGDKTILMKPID